MEQPPQDPPKTPKTPNHKPNGKFAKGNKAAVGHKAPHVSDVKKIRSLLFEAMTEQDWSDVKQALLDRSLKGDVKAMQLLFHYTLGKPATTIDLKVPETVSPDEAKAKVMAFFGIGTGGGGGGGGEDDVK